ALGQAGPPETRRRRLPGPPKGRPGGTGAPVGRRGPPFPPTAASATAVSMGAPPRAPGARRGCRGRDTERRRGVHETRGGSTQGPLGGDRDPDAAIRRSLRTDGRPPTAAGEVRGGAGA